MLVASAAIMGARLVALVSLDFLQVVLRYLLGDGFTWGGDVAVILLLTLAWLGAGHAWLARSHIAVELFALPPALRAALDVVAIAGALILAPQLVATIDAFGFIDLPSLPVSASVKYWPVALGVAFVAIAAAIDLLLLWDERPKLGDGRPKRGGGRRP